MTGDGVAHVHRVALAHGVHPGGLALAPEGVAGVQLVVVVDGKGRLVGRAEQLALVVADDQHHVRIRCLQRVGQAFRRRVAQGGLALLSPPQHTLSIWSSWQSHQRTPANPPWLFLDLFCIDAIHVRR